MIEGNKSRIQPGALVSLNENYLKRERIRIASGFIGGEISLLSSGDLLAIVEKRDGFGRLQLFFLSEKARDFFNGEKTHRACTRLGPDGQWRNLFELSEVDLLAE